MTSYPGCDNCRSGNLENLREIMASMNITTEEKAPIVPVSAYDDEQLVASDKVALIISNCMYLHLPKLVTPHCDAETLATALQDLKYKTVTLADLTLAEMKFVLKEYKKLLGNGVYAVFYFVGHGFEVNGQCYLLPVEAPSEAHRPEHCLSMDFVLNELSDHNPALNLLLLDVCRKFIPYVADNTI
ncbi:unnamed protein product [Strongylus vulgaris]|uniref:Caspase family p20 domain-containing protein n=1 Tax=Strongylus vulgaris TaxID=40348 RepID=A0A3P7KXP3_STRVU|nr:unnamed protein product [Strongylus vulgaris]